MLSGNTQDRAGPMIRPCRCPRMFKPGGRRVHGVQTHRVRTRDYAQHMTATAPNFAELDLTTTPGCLRILGDWTLPIDTPPFFGYTLRPGVTFTYLGVKVDAQAAVQFGGLASPNLYAAGEVMAGNVLGQGYTAGVGMTIGTVFGRIAGDSAARTASVQQGRHLAHA